MYNEDREDSEYDGNLDQNLMKTQIDKFLKKQIVSSNIKSDVIIYLIGVIKTHSKTYIKSDAIIKNRCNFFKYTNSGFQNNKINSVKQVDEPINRDNLKEIKYVTGVKGGLTASETWILELLNSTKMFGKIFINVDNNSSDDLIFDNESIKNLLGMMNMKKFIYLIE